MDPIKEITREVLAVSSRRSFLRRASLLGVAGAVAPAAASLFTPRRAGAATVQPSLSPEQDVAVLNFALNLEYLEAQYYLHATTGSGIIAKGGSTTGGDGSPGGLVTLKQGSTKIDFKVPVIQAYAEEISQDEFNHVQFLRSALAAAGNFEVAQPELDLFNSFNTLAQAANIGTSFDPFADDLSFLLGAFIFEDVGVTAYHGAAALIQNSDYLTAAAGILAVEAYHASEVRTVLYGMAENSSKPSTIINIVQKISDLRDHLANPGMDRDQGITDTKTGAANVVPTDSNSIAFARPAVNVLNIVYGSSNATPGLFFPKGMNGAIK